MFFFDMQYIYIYIRRLFFYKILLGYKFVQIYNFELLISCKQKIAYHGNLAIVII